MSEVGRDLNKSVRDRRGRFEKDHAALPGAGRPPGATNRTGLLVLVHYATELLEEPGGLEAFRQLRDSQPDAFFRIVAGLLPKELIVRSLSAIEVRPSRQEIDAELAAWLARDLARLGPTVAAKILALPESAWGDDAPAVEVTDE
jgi:hypothetical protein